MQQLPIEQLTQEWLGLISRFPTDTATELHAVAQEGCADLAAHFYQEMLAEPQSASFLSHEQVRTRLSKSMQGWIVTVFSTTAAEQLPAVIELQKHVGEIHARIEIPVSLVMRGARHLKRRLLELLAERGLSAPLQQDVGRLGGDLVDLAIEIMCCAFSQSHDRNSRAEEAYRLFSVSQNIGTEKERQRAALLDWENQLMFDLAMGLNLDSLPTLASSEFGLWFRHKAAHAFQGSPESVVILERIEQIDRDLPTLAKPLTDTDNAAKQALLRQVREHSKSIKFLLESLFDQANDLEAGRDVLTRLLNRKFLPVVLGKEVNYSRQTGNSFGVLLIDIDHFKKINDTHGHDSGDLVLQQVATLLAGATRSGDYAFRLGGEEFLVVLVDINPDKALKAAEKMRLRIADERFKLPQGEDIKVTVSIGMAVHDGHPDYQRLLHNRPAATGQPRSSTLSPPCVRH